MIIYGINPVLEALRAGRVKALRIAGRDDERMRELLAFASTHDITPQRVSSEVLLRQARGGVHQGVVADVDEASEHSVEDLVRGARSAPLILVLDGIEDPHNLGAILRSADATGVDGVVIQARRSAARSGVAAKASAGAVAHVRIAEVVNIARALEELKDLGGVDGRPRRRSRHPVRRRRLRCCHGNRARGGGAGPAAAGARKMRPYGVHPHAGACGERQRLGGGRRRIV